MKKVALAEVKDHFSEYLHEAAKEEVVITRHGLPECSSVLRAMMTGLSTGLRTTPASLSESRRHGRASGPGAAFRGRMCGQVRRLRPPSSELPTSLLHAFPGDHAGSRLLARAGERGVPSLQVAVCSDRSRSRRPDSHFVISTFPFAVPFRFRVGRTA